MSSAPAAIEMTMFQWQARQVRRAAAFLAHTVSTTNRDKADWIPAVDENSKCRSALAQVNECIRVNRTFAAILAGKEAEQPEPATTVDDAATRLTASADELAATIEKMDMEALRRTYSTVRGDLPGFAIMEISISNMIYHVGQICQIELLCGDEEFRILPSFMEF